jgi:hypothetical protein
MDAQCIGRLRPELDFKPPLLDLVHGCEPSRCIRRSGGMKNETAYRRRETRRAVRRPVRGATLRVLNMSCLLDVMSGGARAAGRGIGRPFFTERAVGSSPTALSVGLSASTAVRPP